MTDYLLRFDNKQVAEYFGMASGFAAPNENGDVQSNLASHTHAMCLIGDYAGTWWVLFRDLVGIKIPAGGEQFVFWTSESGVPMPISESVPSVFWA